MKTDYILSSIVRCQKLTPSISELLYKKPMFFRYRPGDKVKLLDYDKEYYIASGVQEPWARVLIDNDIYINSPTIRIKREPTNDIPDLVASEPSKTIIFCDDMGVAPCLSFCSTYPSEKLSNIYAATVSNLANNSWLNTHQNVTIKRDVSNLLGNDIPIGDEYNYYVIMDKKGNTLVKDYLLDKGVPDNKVMLSTI